eukprot:TRINITY_DN826_c0_g1_i2.p1 TRINITY_DN826_c0_g1~~TRINITY_DN826_c0_g1_i2.p1  ORF type:complete len:548 (-),score=59.12 TRINITY_DN826_c0_g1_i2:1280-2923(-)
MLESKLYRASGPVSWTLRNHLEMLGGHVEELQLMRLALAADISTVMEMLPNIKALFLQNFCHSANAVKALNLLPSLLDLTVSNADLSAFDVEQLLLCPCCFEAVPSHKRTRLETTPVCRSHCLRSISLRYLKMDETRLRILAQVIGQCTRLESLSLLCPLPTAAHSVLASAVHSSPALTELKICTDVDNSLIASIFGTDVVFGPVQLRTLVFTHGSVTGFGVSYIGDFLLRNAAPQLSRLSLRSNPLGDITGAITSYFGSQTCTLTELDLFDCDISVSSACTVLQEVGRNRTILKLSLARNMLGSQLLPSLIALLKENETLRCLDLSAISFGSEAITPELRECLTKCSLEELRISGNRLGDRGGVMFAEIIQAQLKECCAPSDFITASKYRSRCYLPTQHAVAACVAIQQRMTPKCRLAVLDVSQNRLSAISAFAIWSALMGEDISRHKGLVELRMIGFNERSRCDPFLAWNTIPVSHWVPTRASNEVSDVQLHGEASPHFDLCMFELTLAGNHFGEHSPIVLSGLRTKCRSVLMSTAHLAIADTEP